MEGCIKIKREMLEWRWFADANTAHFYIYCLLKANKSDKVWKNITVPRGSFVGSRSVMSEETGLSQQNIRTALNHLVETGEIKTKSTNKYTILSVCNYEGYEIIQPANNQQTTSKQPANNQQTAQCLADEPKKKSEQLNNININDLTGSSANNTIIDLSINTKSFLKEKKEINKERNEKSAAILVVGDTVGKASEEAATVRTKRFVRPTPEEVSEYCLQRGNGIDGQEFCNYYDSVGWVVGKNKPMKDWQAAVRTWETNRRQGRHGESRIAWQMRQREEALKNIKT